MTAARTAALDGLVKRRAQALGRLPSQLEVNQDFFDIAHSEISDHRPQNEIVVRTDIVTGIEEANGVRNVSADVECCVGWHPAAKKRFGMKFSGLPDAYDPFASVV